MIVRNLNEANSFAGTKSESFFDLRGETSLVELTPALLVAGQTQQHRLGHTITMKMQPKNDNSQIQVGTDQQTTSSKDMKYKNLKIPQEIQRLKLMKKNLVPVLPVSNPKKQLLIKSPTAPLGLSTAPLGLSASGTLSTYSKNRLLDEQSPDSGNPNNSDLNRTDIITNADHEETFKNKNDKILIESDESSLKQRFQNIDYQNLKLSPSPAKTEKKIMTGAVEMIQTQPHNNLDVFKSDQTPTNTSKPVKTESKKKSELKGPKRKQVAIQPGKKSSESELAWETVQYEIANIPSTDSQQQYQSSILKNASANKNRFQKAVSKIRATITLQDKSSTLAPSRTGSDRTQMSEFDSATLTVNKSINDNKNSINNVKLDSTMTTSNMTQKTKIQKITDEELLNSIVETFTPLLIRPRYVTPETMMCKEPSQRLVKFLIEKVDVLLVRWARLKEQK